MNYLAVGINYKNAPIRLREKFSAEEKIANETLGWLKNKSLINEAIFLGTCNRAEVYAVTDKSPDVHVDIQHALCANTGIDPTLTNNLWYTKVGEEAIRHLFRVASSLDSMVIGEAQILGQIKDAYFRARERKTTGPFIDRAMLHAIQIAKKIRAKTNIGKGQVSVASVAVDLTIEHFKDLSNLTVLVIGAGEMGALVVRQLKKRGAGKILIANRTFEKAVMIAEHAGGEVIAWENLDSGLVRADIIVSSTGSKNPVIGKEMVKTAIESRKRPLVIIDLGTPRDIAPQVAQIENVRLFNIDDLQKIAENNSAGRIDEAKKAEKLIAVESERFFSKLSRPRHMETIAVLNQKLEAIGEHETEKTFAKLQGITNEQRAIIKSGAKSIIAKISHDPIKELKDDGLNEPERQILTDALLRLFHLDEK